MRILLTLFALLPALAFGQVTPPKWPTGSDTAGFISGKHGTDDAGHRWAAWYYLTDDGFRWKPQTVVLRRDKVLNLTAPNVGEAMNDYLNRMWVAHDPLPCTDTAISSICDTARTELAKQPSPEPPAFIVSKNGTSLTRPVYRLDLATMTVGELIAGKRAPVNADCACWAYGARKNGTAYCVWVSPTKDTRADEVTACTKKP